MQQVNIIDSDAYQEFSFILDSGIKATVTLRFFPTQRRWVMDISDENGFSANGIFLCCHPNILDKWHNIIDYGIQINTNDMVDPYRQEDFESGYASFVFLNEQEKNSITEYLNGLQ